MSVNGHRVLPNVDINEQGLRELEIFLHDPVVWTEWIYVGTPPTDLDTTSESPPFQNGWANVGGGAQRLRFRRTVPDKHKVQSLEIEGEVVGGTVGTVVTTLPFKFRPAEDGHAVGAWGDDQVAIWKYATTGELTLVGIVTGTGGPGTDTTAIHWGANTDPTGSGVTLSDSGNLLFLLASGKKFTIRDFSNNDILYIQENGQRALTLASGQTFVLLTSTGDTIIEADDAGFLTVSLVAGEAFTVKDSSGNPILQMTEGTTDLHIPTGGNLVADL